MEQNEFELIWRMAKVAGAIDTTVRLLETVIHTRPTFTFHTTAGKEMPIRDLAGLARSVQAATSVRQLEMRGETRKNDWVFPASTSSGHIEKSSIRKQHLKACKLAGMEAFPLYTLRHTCLTRWAAYMDPYTLAYLAGHSDFAITKRYVHPQVQTVRDAMERARGGQSGHTFAE